MSTTTANQDPTRSQYEAQNFSGISPELLQPIPVELPTVEGWKDVEIREVFSDGLAPLGPWSPEFSDIFTNSIYSGERVDSPYRGDDHLDGALRSVFARKSVASRLKQAQCYLPPNMRLIVYDAYRPLTVQDSLYQKYFGDLGHIHPDWTQEQLTAETQKYVSQPSDDKTKPSPHNTGGAVDLAIVRIPDDTLAELQETEAHIAETGIYGGIMDSTFKRVRTLSRASQLLNFGTPFDHGGPESALSYFESLGRTLTEDELEARDNRRLLYNLMSRVGMESYADEWWHYNAPETQMGAKTAGLEYAVFGGVALSPSNLNFERRIKNLNTEANTNLLPAAMISPES